MKSLLIIGLGNTLMGDDGVGCAAAERLAADPRLPDFAEVLCGGTDLLRFATDMHGRSRVMVLDAIADGNEPGSVSELDPNDPAFDTRQDHAHHLSAVAALRLLRLIAPVRCTLLGISIRSAAAGTDLSAEVEARLPEIVERVLHRVERV